MSEGGVTLKTRYFWRISRIRTDTALRLMAQGIATPADAYAACAVTGARQLVQAECEANDR